MRVTSRYSDAQETASEMVRDAIKQVKEASSIVKRMYDDVSKHNPEDSDNLYGLFFKLLNKMENEQEKLKEISQTIYNIEFED